MKRYLVSSAALGAAAILAPDLVRAQAAGGISELVVTASRSGQPERVDTLGASITVISAQDLQVRQTQLVSDVLRDVPGAAVSRTGGVGGLTQVRLRGTESNHTLVLIDGMEVADPYDGEFDFATLIADDVARVEVLRGQQSALYGSDAIGGVIHYITATGAEAPGLRARVEGGSFGTYEGSARAAGVSGPVDYAVSGAFLHTDGAPNALFGTRDLGARIGALSAKVVVTPTDGFRIKAVGRYTDTRADTNDSETDPASPLFGYAVDTPGAHYRARALYGLLRAELDALDGRWTNAVQVQGADARRDGYAAYGRASGDQGARLKGTYESTLRLNSGPLSHTFTGAIDIEREDYRNTDPSGYASTARRHADNIGLVAEYDLGVGDRLGLGAAVRRDENDRFADATTYHLQGSYRFATGTRAHAAAGSGIKNPGFYELYGYVDGRYLGNPDLKPETSDGWEAGLDQAVLGGAVVAGVTYFHSRLKDEIFTDYPPPTYVATPSNRTTDSTQHGVEAVVSARLGAVQVDGGYTWLRARENGVEEVRRAPHIASLNVAWRAPSGRFGANVTVRYNGEQTDVTFTDPTYATTPVVTLPSFTLVDVGADYRLNRTLQLYGRVENLFDIDYQEVFSFRAPGRAAYVGVRAGF